MIKLQKISQWLEIQYNNYINNNAILWYYIWTSNDNGEFYEGLVRKSVKTVFADGIPKEELTI